MPLLRESLSSALLKNLTNYREDPKNYYDQNWAWFGIEAANHTDVTGDTYEEVAAVICRLGVHQD